VRNYQGILRETTDMRLQRKRPLPEIGRSTLKSSVDTETTDTDPTCESDIEPELDFGQRACTPSPPPLMPARTSPPLRHFMERPGTFMGHARVKLHAGTPLDGIPESAPLTRHRLRPLGPRERRRKVLPPVTPCAERPLAPPLSPRPSTPLTCQSPAHHLPLDLQQE
jgi:hypothetical protein